MPETERLSESDYGPKTGAGRDHPYNDPGSQTPAGPPPAGKAAATPPDDHTDIDSEADLGDPSVR